MCLTWSVSSPIHDCEKIAQRLLPTGGVWGAGAHGLGGAVDRLVDLVPLGSRPRLQSCFSLVPLRFAVLAACLGSGKVAFARFVQPPGEIEAFTSWCSAGALLLRAPRIEADERYECDDDDEESDAGVDGAETQAAIGARLRQQIAERGAERSGQNVSQPESQDGVCTQIVSRTDCGDQGAKRYDADIETEAKSFRRQVTRGGAQRKRKKNGGPVEQLTPRSDDCVNGKRTFRAVPDRERRGQSHRECCGAGIKTDIKPIGQCIRDLGADDAD